MFLPKNSPLLKVCVGGKLFLKKIYALGVTSHLPYPVVDGGRLGEHVQVEDLLQGKEGEEGLLQYMSRLECTD